MKNSATNMCRLLLCGIFVVGMSTPAWAGGYGPDEFDDLQNELARTQNDLEVQKDRADDLEGKLDDLKKV